MFNDTNTSLPPSTASEFDKLLEFKVSEIGQSENYSVSAISEDNKRKLKEKMNLTDTLAYTTTFV